MLEISDAEYESLLKVIKTKYNIDFGSYETQSFKRRLARAIGYFKLDGVYGLWARLLKDRDFIYELIDQLTVGLTSFFRDPIMWNDLKSILRKEYASGNLSVWHAGCSTGEEVYSMAIVMKELYTAHQARVLATDLNKTSINVAKAGVYGKYYYNEFNANYQEVNRMRSLESYLVDKNPETNGVRFDIGLIAHVEFAQRNLLEMGTKENFDIIFCRNVMIYFDEVMKRKLLDEFYERLNPGGKFIVGFYDSVLPIINQAKFKTVNEQSKIFVKM